jgi:hypothetical protein
MSYLSFRFTHQNPVNASVLHHERHMPHTSHPHWLDKSTDIWCVAPSDRAVKGVDLQPLAYWDCGFEFRRGHGCQFLPSVLCFQVGVSTFGLTLDQRSPTQCGAPVSVIVKPRKRRSWPGMWSKRHRKETKWYLVWITNHEAPQYQLSCWLPSLPVSWTQIPSSTPYFQHSQTMNFH